MGTTLKGKWTLDHLVGLGGMAAVYAATHRNKKRVAIKVLHPELSIQPPLLERFQREGYAANTVKHPGVASVDDDDMTEDGCAFLVMEFVEGETLETRLDRRGPLTVREVLVYASQVLDTLGTAHARGVVHRDIKPDNLLLGTNGVIKILDFGISQMHDGSDDAERARACTMGTPAFMAPEQARGWWDEIDGQSDLWAVGATMFTLLTGHHIHTAETANEALAFAMTQRPPSPRSYRPDLDEDVSHIVERALEPDKSMRWPDAATMLRAVREAYYAREGNRRPPAEKPTSDRVPRVAWHRALEESWLAGDDRDTLETIPSRVDTAACVEFSAESARYPVQRLSEAGNGPTSPPDETSPPTPASHLPLPSPREAEPSSCPSPALSWRAHTMATPPGSAAPVDDRKSRWSLALTLLGVILVIASVIFTVRRKQGGAPRGGDVSTPAAATHATLALAGVAPVKRLCCRSRPRCDAAGPCRDRTRPRRPTLRLLMALRERGSSEPR